MLYGIRAWGGTFKTYLSKLSTLQNKSVKILTGANYFDHATPSFKNLKILKLADLYKLEVAKIMFRHIRNNFPTTFSNLFKKITHVHCRSFRLAAKNIPYKYLNLKLLSFSGALTTKK